MGFHATPMNESKLSVTETSAIHAIELSKSFRDFPVLDGLDLKIEQGERVALLGKNGSGKTTLIRLIATLNKPDAGTIRIMGLDRDRYGTNIRNIIGVVLHENLLYNELTGYENLRFYARMYGIENVDERIQSLAKQFGVADYLRHKVRTLSNGIQKRLALVRSLIHEPAILLLDEPETGLDSEGLEMLNSFLISGHGRPSTILMTTHNLDQVVALVNSVAILARGHIVRHELLGELSASEFRKKFSVYKELIF